MHRERIATAMALIAMLGAVTTFRASQNELIASGCARRHAVAETYFVYRKQYYANRMDANAEYIDEYRIHLARARRYLRAASGQLPDAGPDKAFFQVEAQLEYAAARQLQPLKDFTEVDLGNLAVGPGLDKKANTDLRSVGFGGGCIINAKHAASLSALELLQSDTDAVRSRAIRCAVTVVLFVLALVFFTLSEAVPKRIKRALEIAGYVLSALAVIAGLVWADPALAQQYALAAGAFAIVAAVGWLALRIQDKRRIAEPTNEDAPAETEILRFEEFDTEGFRAKHLHLFAPEDRFTRAIVIFIAAAAFLSSIAGLAYSAAVADSDRAAMTANAHQAGIVSEYSHVALDLHFLMREMNIGMEQDLRQAALDLIQYGNRRPFGRNDVAPWTYEGVQWMHAFDDMADSKDTKMHPFLEGNDGPYLDARYPYEMYYGREAISPARELALADAYDEDAAIYERGAAYCLFMLTVFAIALYLFGQALAMGTSNGARILAFFGIALIAAGIGVGLRTAIITRTPNGDYVAFSPACPRPASSPAPPATRAQVAASCYAQGEYARRVANDRETYKPAMDAYRRAAALRPQFALAQYQLLDAEDEYATPQRTGYQSIEDPQVLTQMIADRKAVSEALYERELAPPEGFIDSAAFDTYVQSLVQGSRVLLRSSLDLARSDPDLRGDPTSQYNVGLMLLANKEFSEAASAYAAGMRIEPQDEESDISAISDLELLRTQCATLPWHTLQSCMQLAQAADGVKKELIQHRFSLGAADPPQAQPPLHVRAWVAPDGVAWSAPARELQNIHGKIGVLWYVKDPTWHSWYAHLAVMHHTTPGEMKRVGPDLVDYSSYLSDSYFERCLPTRQDFRVEIYNNGRLIGNPDPILGRADDPLFEGSQFGTADVGFCRPGGKTQWTRRIDTHGYLEGSYTDRSGEYVIRVFDLYEPKQSSQRATDALALRYLDEFLFVANAKAGLRPAPFNCSGAINRLEAVRVRATARNSNVLGEAWATPDGLMHFVIVRHARPPSLQDRVACEILNSAQPMYPGMY